LIGSSSPAARAVKRPASAMSAEAGVAEMSAEEPVEEERATEGEEDDRSCAAVADESCKLVPYKWRPEEGFMHAE